MQTKRSVFQQSASATVASPSTRDPGEEEIKQETDSDNWLDGDCPIYKGLSTAEIEIVRKMVKDNNRYQLDKTFPRNVIFVGRSRSGKSTFINMLRDPTFSPETNSIFSQTAEARFTCFSLQHTPSGTDPKNSIKYTINTVDTPGLYEQKEHGQDERNNEMLTSTIVSCLKNELTSVNCVFLFASFDQGINPHDLSAIEHFLKLFAAENVNIALVITRAENRDEKQQEAMLKEIKSHTKMKELLATYNIQHIFFAGVVDLQDRASTTSKDHLKECYRTVYKMRAKVLDWIFASESKKLLIELPVVNTDIAKGEAHLNSIYQKLIKIQEKKEHNEKDLVATMRKMMQEWEFCCALQKRGLISASMHVLAKKVTKEASQITRKLLDSRARPKKAFLNSAFLNSLRLLSEVR